METASLILFCMAFNLYDPNVPKIKKEISKETLNKIKKYGTIVLGLLALVALMAIVISIWPKTPSLTVRCKVPSKVYIDGTEVGSGTTVIVKDIKPGRHEVVAKPVETIPFLPEDRQRVDILPGRGETIELVNVSEVSFETKPEKATILLSSLEGDTNLGKTPFKTKLPFGQYQVVMRLPGFPEYEKSFLSSGAEDILINTDFDQLALENPGSRKLTANLIVPKLRDGATLKVDGKEYAQGTQSLLPSGFHNVCMFYYSSQIICTQVMFPSVGKPVEISWPETVYSPCMYFGQDLFTLPGDARGISVSQDGSSLLYSTGYPFIDAVDLVSGQRVWTEKVDRAFDLRPVIVLKTDGNNIYGMAGIPSDERATPFCIEIKTGKEKPVLTDHAGSVLPFTGEAYAFGDWRCFGHVWESTSKGEGKISAIEAVVVKQLETRRFIRKLESGESARFLGVSFAATNGTHPIFLFSLSKSSSSSILVLDPTLAVPHRQVEYKEKNREQFFLIIEAPSTEDSKKGWKLIPSPIDAKGASFDAGFETGGNFIVYSDLTVASISLNTGKLKWSRFVDKPRKVEPTISRSKGRDVVLLSFPTSPFEYQLDLLTGNQIERRVKAQTAEEAVPGIPCQGGSFVLPGNKAVSGVKADIEGKFKPTWEKTFKTGLLLASPWGPVRIENSRVEILGSHKLEPILVISLPGLGTPLKSEVLGEKRFLAIWGDGRLWIIDRDGLIRGFFTGIDRIEPLESSGQRAILAGMDGRKVVIPWPQN